MNLKVKLLLFTWQPTNLEQQNSVASAKIITKSPIYNNTAANPMQLLPSTIHMRVKFHESPICITDFLSGEST